MMILIMYYHEPWFDEAQAWLIARDCDIKTLIMSITHYEGHPPIWYLILMPLAKNGIPFEIGIKIVNLFFSATAIGIFTFKAPFPLFYRCTIPYTYFFFYQFGVLSRPYSMMMLGFVLSAATYKKRNKSPFIFAATLLIICSASAYGMIIAAGISLAWVVEYFNNSLSLNKIKLFIKSRNFYALILIIFYNIILLFCIFPYPDTYGINSYSSVNKFAMMAYLFFVAPGDAIFSTKSVVYLGGYNNIGFAFLAIGSVIINFLLIRICKKFNKLMLLILPYAMFLLFSGLVYFSYHNLGIIVMFYMFILWCCFDDKTEIISYKNDVITKFNVNFIKVVFIGIISISIYSTATASYYDVKYNYGTGRETAKFITDNKLENLNIWVAWKTITNNPAKYDYNFLLGIPELAYFNNNIFSNFNNKSDDTCYLLHRLDTSGEYLHKTLIENYPDVLIASDDPSFSFGSEIDMNDFVVIKKIFGNTIWKSTKSEYTEYIYLRKDLLRNFTK